MNVVGVYFVVVDVVGDVLVIDVGFVEVCG